jgi:DNA polymerase-3 subunit delta'
LDLARLGDADLAAAIAGPLAARKAEPLSGEAVVRLAALSGGSVRRALELSVGGGLELHERILRLFGDQAGGEGVHKLADELAPSAAEPAFMLFFSLLQDLLGRVARHATTGAGALAGEDRLAKHWATPDRLASLATLWETIAREKAQTLQLNLDRKALILETFRRIEQDIRSSRA